MSSRACTLFFCCYTTWLLHILLNCYQLLLLCPKGIVRIPDASIAVSFTTTSTTATTITSIKLVYFFTMRRKCVRPFIAIASLNSHNNPLRWKLGQYPCFNVVHSWHGVDADMTWGCFHSHVLGLPQEHLPPPSHRWGS